MYPALVNKLVFDCQGMPEDLRRRYLDMMSDCFSGNDSYLTFTCGAYEDDDAVSAAVEQWVRANAGRDLGKYEDVIILVWW